jgi:integrase
MSKRDTGGVLLKKDGTPRKGPGGRRKGQRTGKDFTNVHAIRALTARKTRVAPNLWLQTTKRGSKSWVVEWMQKDATGQSKRYWMGLGSFPEVSFQRAKDLTIDAMRLVKQGKDPRKPIVVHRFQDVALEWWEMRRHEWRKNEDGSDRRYASDVKSELTRLAFPMIGEMDVEVLDTPHIRAVLWQPTDNDQPLWIEHTPMAVRLRGFIQEAIGYARANKWRTGFNCAVWDDNLTHMLPSPKKIHKPKPHASCHPDEIKEFMQVLRRMVGVKFRLLEILILTCLRAEECRGATWPEIDLKMAIWDVSSLRMKKGNEHCVLLSQQVIRLFRELPHAVKLVFGENAEDVLREAVAEVMAEAGRKWQDRKTGELITPHGFRASFATWGIMQDYDRVQIRLALGHVVDGDTLRRYLRSQESQQRRDMMQAWADYLMA